MELPVARVEDRQASSELDFDMLPYFLVLKLEFTVVQGSASWSACLGSMRRSSFTASYSGMIIH